VQDLLRQFSELVEILWPAGAIDSWITFHESLPGYTNARFVFIIHFVSFSLSQDLCAGDAIERPSMSSSVGAQRSSWDVRRGRNCAEGVAENKGTSQLAPFSLSQSRHGRTSGEYYLTLHCVFSFRFCSVV
jgi:hypothetical protein